jgi:hypothetical protein
MLLILTQKIEMQMFFSKMMKSFWMNGEDDSKLLIFKRRMHLLLRNKKDCLQNRNKILIPSKI